MKEYILGIDVETTGLDPATAEMTEIAWAIYEVNDMQKPHVARSYLVGIDAEEVPAEIVELTGITTGHCEMGDEPAEALQKLFDDIQKFRVRFVVAHNGAFDIGFLTAGFTKVGIPIPALELIDTAKDVPYPKEISTRTLRFLAVEHGFMNPFPHSALFDVFCMMRVFSCYAWQDVLDYKNEPEIIVKAHCDFHTKEKAKAARFWWEKAGDKTFPKTWVKVVKQRELAEQSKTWDFTYEVIG